MKATDTFLLRERIHRGGMGLVWRAQQHSFAGRTRIHLSAPELAALPGMLRHIRHEAHLGHERNAAAVIEQVADGSVVVMERAEGQSLAWLLRTHGRFALDRAVELVEQILEALGAVHDTGMVHADIQPASVMVDACEDGDVVSLVDFGGFDDAGGAGATEYLAPEVIQGGAPTVASDIYAVGVILYELLTGVPPFRGATAIEVMTRQLHHAPAPLSLYRLPEKIPAAIERACLRAMTRDPQARFRDARSFAAALRAKRMATLVPSEEHVERLRAVLAETIEYGTGTAVVDRSRDLALLLERCGRHAEAIATLEHAIGLVMWGDQELVAQLRTALVRLHEQAQPVH